MDFELFMERYGYEILLRLMVTMTLGFTAGLIFFWSQLTNGAASLAVVYGVVMALLKRLYEFLSGEKPDVFSEITNKNMEKGRRYFFRWQWR